MAARTATNSSSNSAERNAVGLLRRRIRRFSVKPGAAQHHRVKGEQAKAEDALRVRHMPEHFLQAPLPLGVTVPAPRFLYRGESFRVVPTPFSSSGDTSPSGTLSM